MEIVDLYNDGSIEEEGKILTVGASIKRRKSLHHLQSVSKRKNSNIPLSSPDRAQIIAPSDVFQPSSTVSHSVSGAMPKSAAFLYSSNNNGGSIPQGDWGYENSSTRSTPLAGNHEVSRDGNGLRFQNELAERPALGRGISYWDEECRKPSTTGSTINYHVEKPRLLQQKSSNSILRKRAQNGFQTPASLSVKTSETGAPFSMDQPSQMLSNENIARRPHTAGAKAFLSDIRKNPHPTPEKFGSAKELEMPRDPRTELISQSSWEAFYDNDGVRESFRSTLTTSSSHFDSASTDNTSIFTKDSYISDATSNNVDSPVAKDEGMTVDEAIGMYSAGFTDSRRDLLHEDQKKTATNIEEIRRRSLKIAEAMNDSLDSILLLCPSPSSPALRDSVAIMSGAAFKSAPSQAPTSTPVSSNLDHDQYGFEKTSHHISSRQYDIWYNEYSVVQRRRNRKWELFMKDQGLPHINPTRFPDRSAKVQRFVRKGIPPLWRGAAWFFYAGGNQFLHGHPHLYDDLVLRARAELSKDDKDSIERDLHRTFPDNIYYKPEGVDAPIGQSPLLVSLRHVLFAFALHHPRIGYCQSLNFIAGLLLLFLSEEKAFWMLHIITKSYLPSTHDTSLEGTNVDLWVLMLAMKDFVPGIWAKIGGDLSETAAPLPPVSLCTMSWFMSLFIGTLPIESVLRVWDVLFYEGSRTLFRVAIAIFKLGENEIKAINDPMEVFQVVQGLPRGMLDIAQLMEIAIGRCGITQGWVERKRKLKREWYAKERQRLGNSASDNGPTNGTLQSETTGRDRSNSVWRRRIGMGK
ncbi:hypothetical protein MMC06_000746 [Schaereria dolodes]|nr:hypothetical protein [Schaereria dolodes]